jgi:hypothetical protein
LINGIGRTEREQAGEFTRGKLKVTDLPIITVIGKAFWDIGHASKDQSNQRKRLPDYAVWELHPAMQLTVQRPKQPLT